MRHCKQCHGVLDAPEPALPVGPALGESYVLLPTALSPRGVRHAFASLTQSALHEPWESALLLHAHAQPSLAEAARGASSGDPGTHPENKKPSALAESIIAVATHADLSDNVRTLNAYHAHCSGQPVQTPVCKDCVDAMLAQIDSHAERARHEKRAFGGFLQSTGSSVRNEEVDQINEKIKFYEDELRALEENLELMDKEREELAARHQQLEKEGEALGREEATLWIELNELQFHDEAFQEYQGTARARLAALEASAAATRAQNMVREMFYISQKGPFGTINGFRLGQLPTEQVEWNEINTALGESALLVITMASLLGIEFSDFKIVPVGSFSKVIRVSSVRMEYRLHGSDQDMFTESHFNLGLGAWITCIGQLMGHVEAQDRTMKFPYKVSKHTIGGRSVLYLKNKQTEWTKALRYALTDLKWLQEWAAKRVIP